SNVLPGLLDFLGNRESSGRYSYNQLSSPDMHLLKGLEPSTRIKAVLDGAWLRFVQDPKSETMYSHVINQVRTEQLFWEHSIKLLETNRLQSEEGAIRLNEKGEEGIGLEKLRDENERLRREPRSLKTRITVAKGLIRRVEHHPIGGQVVQQI